VTLLLQTKPVTHFLWGVAHFSNSFLRCIGQTVFVNNPWLSAIILLAIILSDSTAGLACVLGGVIGTCVELFLGLHPWSFMENGVAPFNSALFGSVLPVLHSFEQSSQLWLAVLSGAIACVFIASGLNNLLSKFDLPYLTLPFNIMSVCTFIFFLPPEYLTQLDSSSLTLPHNSTMQDNYTVSISTIQDDHDVSISWLGVGQGILLSMGQVYAVNNLLSSLLMCLAVGLYSPLLLCMSMLGASLGTILPLAFIPTTDYTQIYQGLWGYCPLLSMAAVSCVFVSFSSSSFLAGFVTTVITVFVQRVLVRALREVPLPVFTLPFALPTLLILISWQHQGKRKLPSTV